MFNIKRQLNQLKHKNDVQELKILELQREIHLFEEKKKKIADKWNSLNSREMALQVLKSTFEEQFIEFLNDYGSGNDDHQPRNESDQIDDTLNNYQIGLSANGIKTEGSANGISTEGIMEERKVLPDLMKNNAGNLYTL